MTHADIETRIKAQDFLCAYPHEPGAPLHERQFKRGDELALAYDGNGIVHLACAKLGTVQIVAGGVVRVRAGK